MRTREAVCLLFALALIGCEPPPDVSRMQLSFRLLPEASGCRPSTDVDVLRLSALGDFSARDEHIEDLRPAESLSAIDRFPFDTRVLSVDARLPAASWGGGVRRVDEGPAAVLLLPFGVGCPLGDEALAPAPGAAVTATGDGGLLIAGGLIDEDGMRVASRHIALLPPGATAAVVESAGLDDPREGATATATGSRVLIAGGALGASGPAYDTFELFDLGAGGIVGTGTMTRRRRDHGATRLPDGTVLLVGGVSSRDGADDTRSASSSAERVDLRAGLATAVGDLPVPRTQPTVVTLDDGTVLVIGGFGAPGGFLNEVLTFDPASNTFSSAFTPDAVALTTSPCRPRAIPLTGARAVLFGDAIEGCRLAPGVTILRRLPPYLAGGVRVSRVDIDLSAMGVPDLTGVAAAPLPDGRFLLTGRATEAPFVRSYVVDPGTSRATLTPTSAQPFAAHELHALADGAVAGLDESGATLRRDLLTTPFDQPPNTLLAGFTDGVAFDLAVHWARDGARFVALVDEARLDVPTLSFTDVEVELEIDGPGELLLTREVSAPLRVNVLSASAGPPLCEVARVPGAPVLVQRRDDTLTISAGAEERQCAVVLTDRVGIAVRAKAGTAITRLGIRRLDP